MASMRKSGVPEDFEEREALLTDIKTRIDDYVEVDAARKDTDKKKKEGIELQASCYVCLLWVKSKNASRKNESGHHIRKLAWLKAFYLPSGKVERQSEKKTSFSWLSAVKGLNLTKLKLKQQQTDLLQASK
ncbi:unnamed protein product [Aphanomyces euteiches]